MKQELMSVVTEKTKEPIDSVACSAETRAAAQTWLDTVGTQRIEEVTRAYIEELEEDIATIQDLIALVGSNQGKRVFNEEETVQVAEHTEEIKQQGALYYDCPACTTAACILEKKDELLKAMRDK